MATTRSETAPRPARDPRGLTLPESLGGPRLSEEQTALRDRVRAFVEQNCPLELQQRHDEDWRFPYEAWEGLAEEGLMGVCVPAEYGGTGGSTFDQTIMCEELARGWFALGEAFATSTFSGTKTLVDSGSDEQKAELLPRFVRGEVRFAFGFTEPDGGTDVLGALKTVARRDGGDYVVNGAKMFTTMADVSDYVVLLVRTDPDARRKSEGLSALLVPSDAPGVEIRRLPTVGLNSTATNRIFFEDVRVPAANLIGEEGNGWRTLVASLNNERVVVSAVALGNAQGAFEYAVDFAREREAFGRTIGSFQAIQLYVAEMATRLTTARLLLYDTARRQVAGEQCEREATMTKLCASETGVRVTDLGMRIMAGRGFTTEHPMQRYFRDARVFTFGPITNEVGQLFLAQRLGLPRSY